MIQCNCIDGEYLNIISGCSNTLTFHNYKQFYIWMRTIAYENQESIFNNVKLYIGHNCYINQYYNDDRISSEDTDEYDMIKIWEKQEISEECKNSN